MLSLLSEESVKLFETQSPDAKAKTITVLATFANITKCMLDKQEQSQFRLNRDLN